MKTKPGVPRVTPLFYHTRAPLLQAAPGVCGSLRGTAYPPGSRDLVIPPLLCTLVSNPLLSEPIPPTAAVWNHNRLLPSLCPTPVYHRSLAPLLLALTLLSEFGKQTW